LVDVVVPVSISFGCPVILKYHYLVCLMVFFVDSLYSPMHFLSLIAIGSVEVFFLVGHAAGSDEAMRPQCSKVAT
jgi:hypothetical protein